MSSIKDLGMDWVGRGTRRGTCLRLDRGLVDGADVGLGEGLSETIKDGHGDGLGEGLSEALQERHVAELEIQMPLTHVLIRMQEAADKDKQAPMIGAKDIRHGYRSNHYSQPSEHVRDQRNDTRKSRVS